MDLNNDRRICCYKKFNKFCYCIDLEAGVNIIGILQVCGFVSGIIGNFHAGRIPPFFFITGASAAFAEFIALVNTPDLTTLFFFIILGLVTAFPAVAYLLMLKKTNEETKNRFARWYLYSHILGWIALLIISIIS